MRKKGHKAFWHNIKFKYKLTIINENTLEEVVGIHVSKLNGLSVLIFACTIIFIIAASIIVFTPLRNYLPGYMNSEVREMVVANALHADSLKQALDRQNMYIMNIQDIFSGKVHADTIQSIDSLTNLRAEQLKERTKEEEEFRREYEQKERYNLRAIDNNNAASGLVFFKPVRGMMEVNFDPENRHYGIDLMTSPNENIMAVLDGTVIMATYTVSDGYVIQIQHSQNFISIYKHCGSLMKQSGDKVKGGDVIALIGKGEDKEKKSYLHFELWHRGTPINPEKYVVF